VAERKLYFFAGPSNDRAKASRIKGDIFADYQYPEEARISTLT
jgi:hypothetical protein